MNWQTYIQRTMNAGPRPLLIKAASFAQRGSALDFGAGSLRDSKHLLSLGFSVTALDSTRPDPLIKDPQFNFIKSSFEEFVYPQEKYTLISGQFAFPFISRNGFSLVWDKLYDSLKEGGIITGQFFGHKDDWFRDPEYGLSEKWEGPTEIVFHTREEVQDLLKKYTIISLNEREYDSAPPVGRIKHWDVFFFIARKSIPTGATSASNFSPHIN